MNTGVLGTGPVGRALAARFAALGHTVTLGTRDLRTTLARAEADARGVPPLSAWLAQHPEVRLGSFADAAAHAEIVVNATNGAGSLEALTQAGADSLAGTIVMNVANPLDFSRGTPPRSS